MIRFSAPTRISISLASLVLALVCCAQSLGLIPDPRPAVLDGRRALCEAVAVQACLAAQREDLAAMRTITAALVERNAAVLSTAIRKVNGKAAASAGDHDVIRSTLDDDSVEQVEIPIFKGKQRWGTLEICFEPITQGMLEQWAPRAIWLGLGIAFISLLVSRFYLRRILQHLDPSSVIPERVRATLDTLAEGVLVLDKSQRIVLANKSFANKVGRASGDLQGKRASDFPWFEQPGSAELPWKTAIDEGASKTGTLLSLKTQAEDRRTFVVNATPILGADGKGRGALATFDDVTSIEEKNQQLEDMLEALRASRDEVRRQNKELEVLANNDSLTGCLNRRALFAELDEQWKSRGKNQGLSCIMVDIDHFKPINDTYGHAVGDRVLQMVARVLRSGALTDHSVGRYGGEEFALLLPNTGLDEAARLAEMLRTRIETVRHADKQVTASLGVASTEQNPSEPADLLNFADQALYYSKHSGRNRVTTWPQVPAGWQGAEELKNKKKNASLAKFDGPIPFHAVTALSAALAFRDPLTAEHSRRVADLSLRIARGLLPEKECYLLEVAALLHDIGKLGVPDAILLKPAPLTEEEWKIMSSHDNIGVEILAAAFSSAELTAIVANCHAWFSGNPEFPQLPSGEAIPIGARILVIADAYDAMVSDRAYRKGRTRDEAIAELGRCAGKQFDPQLVERFAQLLTDEPALLPTTPTPPTSALRLGQQLERVTAALEEKNYAQLAHLAAQLALTAQVEGPSRLVTLATELEQAARDEPDMHALVALTTELLQLCESQQTSYLKGLQTAAKA